jgi:predicted permease
MLALAIRRERELSIRAALGATRSQTIRQMLLESALLATLGAIGGGILTIWCTGLINRQIATAEVPFWYRAVVDWRVVAVMSALTLLAALATGLVPALRASRWDIKHLLQAHSVGASGLRLGRLTRWLVTLQVTIACALLGVTGILTKSVIRTQSLELSFDPDNHLAVPVHLPAAQFPAAPDRLRFFDDLRTEIGALPGVERVVLSSRHPASRGAAARIEIQGQSFTTERDLPLTLIESVDAAYFETMNIPVLQGRGFSDRDRRGTAPVAIVTQAFVRATWPGESPLGKQLRLRQEDWATVIGVVPDTARLGIARPEQFPRIYFAHAQQAWERMVVLIQTRQNSAVQALAIRRIVNRLAPDLAVERVESLSASLTEALKIPKLINAIFLGAGAAAIFLAALGVFGVVSFSVNQRTRDFAIRMALGAQRRQILAHVLRRSLVHLLFGLALGTALAFALGKQLATELLGVAAFDPQISLLIAGFVTLIGLFAVILPARKAMNADPIVALRDE